MAPRTATETKRLIARTCSVVVAPRSSRPPARTIWSGGATEVCGRILQLELGIDIDGEGRPIVGRENHTHSAEGLV